MSSGQAGKDISMACYSTQSVMRNSSPRGCGPEPVTDKEVGLDVLSTETFVKSPSKVTSGSIL